MVTRLVAHFPLVFHFFGHHTVTDQDFEELAGFGPINTDDYPILEYRAPVQMYACARLVYPERRYGTQSPHNLLRYLRQATVTTRQWIDSSNYFASDYKPDLIGTILEEIVGRDPGCAEARVLLSGFVAWRSRGRAGR